MALIHEVVNAPDSPANQTDTAISVKDREALVEYIRAWLWGEFFRWQDTVLVDVRVFGIRLIRKTVKQLLRRKFVEWFGPPPVDVPMPAPVAA